MGLGTVDRLFWTGFSQPRTGDLLALRLVFRLPGCWGIRLERESVNCPTRHRCSHGTIDQLVLLNQGLAFKQGRNYYRLIMIAAASEIGDLHDRIGNSRLDAGFDLTGSNRAHAELAVRNEKLWL
jgi:hypothetical protein